MPPLTESSLFRAVGYLGLLAPVCAHLATPTCAHMDPAPRECAPGAADLAAPAHLSPPHLLTVDAPPPGRARASAADVVTLGAVLASALATAAWSVHLVLASCQTQRKRSCGYATDFVEFSCQK